MRLIFSVNIIISKLADRCRRRPEGSLFISYLHLGVGEGATPFPGLLHFTLNPYLLMLSVKQGGIKYHFWVFGMTRPGIEHRTIGEHPVYIYNRKNY